MAAGKKTKHIVIQVCSGRSCFPILGNFVQNSKNGTYLLETVVDFLIDDQMSHKLNGKLVEFERNFFKVVEVHFLVDLTLVLNTFLRFDDEVLDMELQFIDISERFEGVH